jgi:hypothetical protein
LLILSKGARFDDVAYLNTSALQQLDTYFVGTFPTPYNRNVVSNTFTIDQQILEKTLEFASSEWLLSSYIATFRHPDRYSGMDYRSICTKLQPVLFQSCATLVNSDGSLTSEGTRAMHCIRNGILLGGGAALFGLPLSVILKGLSMLAAPTGCDGIVNMKAFDQLGDIGSLSSLRSLLP